MVDCAASWRAPFSWKEARGRLEMRLFANRLCMRRVHPGNVVVGYPSRNCAVQRGIFVWKMIGDAIEGMPC